jgi:hypothetical protein
MKLAGRQSTLLFLLVIALIFMAYIIFIQTPESERIKEKNLELSNVEATKKQIDATILAGEGLNAEIEAYKVQITDIEQRLLPVIESQVISQKIQDKFVQHGIPFITLISTEMPMEDRVLEPDETTISPNLLRSVRFNFQVSGTDGRNMSILDAGMIPPENIPATEVETENPEDAIIYKVVGYEEFMKAVKDIEDDLPESIKIKSISLEDSGQGFMLYNVSVVVYSYDLPDRISEPVMEGDYITWTGAPVNNIAKDGLIGIPYASIPTVMREEMFDRPFALFPVAPEETTAE